MRVSEGHGGAGQGLCIRENKMLRDSDYRCADYRCTYVCNRYHRLPPLVVPNTLSCDPPELAAGEDLRVL